MHQCCESVVRTYLPSQIILHCRRLLTTTILRLFQSGNMAREGLRTLVVSKKVLSEDQYQDFEVTPPPPSVSICCPISCSDVVLLHLMLLFCEQFSFFMSSIDLVRPKSVWQKGQQRWAVYDFKRCMNVSRISWVHIARSPVWYKHLAQI